MGATLNIKECDRMRVLVVEDDHLLNHTFCGIYGGFRIDKTEGRRFSDEAGL